MKNTILVLFILVLSCHQRKEEQVVSHRFEQAENRGEVSPRIAEVSGLVASIANPGYLWAINDSKNAAEIFLLNETAEIVLTCKLKKIKNRDWEDIAIGPGKEAGVNYLYIGEIGDNDRIFEFKYIYRLKEPVFEKDDKTTIHDFDTLIIRMPDGSRDLESMAIDHSSGDVYLVSKREENVNVYRLPQRSLVVSDTVIPEKIASLPFQHTVAIDFSFDNRELLLKTYKSVYYWKKPDSLNIVQTLLLPPEKVDYKREAQGESIAWTLDGSGFYTLSESVQHERASLYFYKKVK